MFWSENDFLERLMPQLRRERGGSNGACPDTATVMAVIDGDADEWLRNAYAQHLAQCSACLELDTRLRNFDRPVLADEREWRQTEKRLDNWMDAFLPSQATVAVAQAVEKRDARGGLWQSVWKPGAVWKISLATAFLALVAVGVDVYLRLQPPVQARQATATTNASPATEPVPVPPPVENTPPKIEEPKSPQSQIAAPAVPATAGGALYQHGPMAAAPKTAPLLKPQRTPEETATAPSRTGSPETPGAQRNELAASTPAAAVAAEQTPQPAQPTLPPAESQTQASATPPSENAGASPHSSFGAFSVRPAASTKTGEPQPSETAKAPAAAPVPPRVAVPNPPASLHLGSGARLWITLDSVSRHPDDSFTFSGSLLLPLSASGSSTLDRGTTLSGWGSDAQGRTSLVISEIVVGGSHYKLKSRAGAGKVRTTGSGGAVSFDSGKVLEVWLSSDSIYERSTAESPQ